MDMCNRESEWWSRGRVSRFYKTLIFISNTCSPFLLFLAEAARAFLKQRLQGGVQRSNEMLQPAKIGGVFVFGPKAT
jgi:hypothetical protein